MNDAIGVLCFFARHQRRDAIRASNDADVASREVFHEVRDVGSRGEEDGWIDAFSIDS